MIPVQTYKRTDEVPVHETNVQLTGAGQLAVEWNHLVQIHVLHVLHVVLTIVEFVLAQTHLLSRRVIMSKC